MYRYIPLGLRHSVNGFVTIWGFFFLNINPAHYKIKQKKLAAFRKDNVWFMCFVHSLWGISIYWRSSNCSKGLWQRQGSQNWTLPVILGRWPISWCWCDRCRGSSPSPQSPCRLAWRIPWPSLCHSNKDRDKYNTETSGRSRCMHWPMSMPKATLLSTSSAHTGAGSGWKSTGNTPLNSCNWRATWSRARSHKVSEEHQKRSRITNAVQSVT